MAQQQQKQLPILVFGATGHQGGALIDSLISIPNNFSILAVTRDTNSSSAKKLSAKSPSKITLIQGDLEDTDAIFTKAIELGQSPWGVFSIQAAAFGKEGIVIEERQAANLLASSLACSTVQRYVQTSVDRGGPVKSPTNPTNVPHFTSKHNIEKALISAAEEKQAKQQKDGLKFTYTIIRPTAFMDNFDESFFAKVFTNSWKSTIKSRPIQLIAAEDIGVFAAKAFLAPEGDKDFENKAISIAGDELTWDEFVQVYSAEVGHKPPTTYGIIVSVMMAMVGELKSMIKYMDVEGYAADIQETKRLHPQVLDMRTYLQKKKAGKA